MPDITVRPLTSDDRDWARRLIVRHWGAETVVGHEAIYCPHELPGFVAQDGRDLVGLVTYHAAGNVIQVVTINSLRQGRGVGKALMEAVISLARDQGCRRLWLITTNDNLNALKFYQKCGFRLVAVHPGTVDRARQIKPSIPRIGEHSIPIRDEIELEMILTR